MTIRLYDSARKVMARLALEEVFTMERVGPILDLGCGPGLIANWLGERQGFVVHGLDIAPRSIEAAQRSATGANTFALYDGTHIPYPDDYFALALCLEVLEHVEDDRAVLDELRRVLRPGARLLLSTPNADTTELAGKHHHRRHYTEAHLRDLLSQAGFQVTSVTHRYHRIGAFIDRLLANRGAKVVATETVEDDALIVATNQSLPVRAILGLYDRVVDPLVDRLVWAEYRHRRTRPGASLMVHATKPIGAHALNQTPTPL